ncbi:MAG TPA: hypothetical protein DCE25_04800 [Pseudomonas sp.]|nr:hypothetical protein [Pseudomonas sp.]
MSPDHTFELRTAKASNRGEPVESSYLIAKLDAAEMSFCVGVRGAFLITNPEGRVLVLAEMAFSARERKRPANPPSELQL